jgi:hypothetical protein
MASVCWVVAVTAVPLLVLHRVTGPFDSILPIK